MYNNSLTLFATTYNCSTYGSGSFSDQSTCTTGTSGQPSTGSTLVNTGMNVAAPLLIGIILIVTALVLLVKRKRTPKNNTMQ